MLSWIFCLFLASDWLSSLGAFAVRGWGLPRVEISRGEPFEVRNDTQQDLNKMVDFGQTYAGGKKMVYYMLLDAENGDRTTALVLTLWKGVPGKLLIRLNSYLVGQLITGFLWRDHLLAMLIAPLNSHYFLASDLANSFHAYIQTTDRIELKLSGSTH